MDYLSEYNTWGVFWRKWVQLMQSVRGRPVVSRRKVAGALRFLLNANGLQVEYIRILHEALLVLVFMYGSETI